MFKGLGATPGDSQPSSAIQCSGLSMWFCAGAAVLGPPRPPRQGQGPPGPYLAMWKDLLAILGIPSGAELKPVQAHTLTVILSPGPVYK